MPVPRIPDHIKRIFFEMLSGRQDISEFEQWVYASPELENILHEDDYLELLSFNYKKSGARYELSRLLGRLVDAGEYEKWKLVVLLNRIKIRDNNLPAELERVYDLYCSGYTFLYTLGMGFGLTVCALSKKYSADHWGNLSAGELEHLVQSLPMLIIRHEADIILQWLEDGGIVLTGQVEELDYYNYTFIDNRSEAEKNRKPDYGHL